MTWFISITISQTSCCFSIDFHCIQVNYAWTLQHLKSSTLSIFTPLIFEMQLINSALFLNAKFLFLLLASLSPSRVISPFTTIYASLKPHKSDLRLMF